MDADPTRNRIPRYISMMLSPIHLRPFPTPVGPNTFVPPSIAYVYLTYVYACNVIGYIYMSRFDGATEANVKKFVLWLPHPQLSINPCLALAWLWVSSYWAV